MQSDSGAERRLAPLRRALRTAALIDAVVATVVVALCLLLRWTSRDELMTALLVTGSILIVFAGFGASGTRMLPNTNPYEAAREALVEAHGMGPGESTRTMGFSAVVALAAVPLLVAGLALHASP